MNERGGEGEGEEEGEEEIENVEHAVYRSKRSPLLLTMAAEHSLVAVRMSDTSRPRRVASKVASSSQTLRYRSAVCTWIAPIKLGGR